jgi:hypothetical protein
MSQEAELFGVANLTNPTYLSAVIFLIIFWIGLKTCRIHAV